MGSVSSSSELARCVSPQGMCLPGHCCSGNNPAPLSEWVDLKATVLRAENIPPPAHLWETNSESTRRWPKLVYEFCRDCSAQFSRGGSQCIQHQISLFLLEGELLASENFRS